MSTDAPGRRSASSFPPSEPAHDRLDALAVQLAHQHLGQTRRATPRNGDDILKRLEANRRQLRANYSATLKAAESGGWISPAGEWLLDNFHVICEQLREARDNLPRRFYQELPELAIGPSAGQPRAFAIATELIVCTDGLLDVNLLRRFLGGYQSVTPLTIGELWAIPIALRHGFLARLAEIARRVEIARRERDAAASLADDLAALASSGAVSVAEALARRVSGRETPSTTMFATELALRLRDRHPALALANAWLERRIAELGTTLEESFRDEHRSQARNQVSVGNCITSMRTITATDWSKVFESLSVVERVLREDPSGDYPRMDFRSRDRYRHVIERLGKRTGRAEAEIAERAVARCRGGEPAAIGADHEPGEHVGFHLMGRGLAALEAEIGYVPTVGERVARALFARATWVLLAPIFVATLSISLGVLFVAQRAGAGHGVAVLLAALSLLPASELSVGLVNLLITATVAPTKLAKLDFGDGIPAELRTLVAVPMMLVDGESIDALVEGLELRYLANPDPALGFALLSDFTDAARETTPSDPALIERAAAGIHRLNERHGARFHLLHRRRVWSDSEQKYIGWERKRGKLAELDQVLVGQLAATTFSLVVSDEAWLLGVRYVITLDTDTQLPLGTAARLVGTIAHPLNRPRFDPATGVVTDGYAILQPRVSVSPRSLRGTPFARIFADKEGIDPYTTAVSDVYQDLFGEGSFVGKGIYDVRAFEAAMAGRIPEGVILSHDLLEGLFARAGLVSDVELYDDTPARYVDAALRRHRWIRGDWQLAPWLFGTPPRGDGRVEPNRLRSIQRWKILDNLRRSLVAPATLAWVFAGWLATGSPLSSTLLVAALVSFPVFSHWLSAIVRGSTRLPLSQHLRRVTSDAKHGALRALVSLLFLPHDAWISVDAVARVLYRRKVSGRGLLEWMPAAQAHQRSGSIGAAWRAMAAPVALVWAAFIASVSLHGTAALSLLGVVALWTMAPAIAWRISRPTPRPREHLGPVAVAFLRHTARKTWGWFETFVTEEDHFLPPDNFQETPSPLVAHRTSPTNIGLSLLANFAALDLGYLGRGACVARIERTLSTIELLEQHRGHLLNWYDTRSLVPLSPRYVSTVDSGNLAGLLMTLRQACLEATDEIPMSTIVDGLADTRRILDEELSRGGERAPHPKAAAFDALLDARDDPGPTRRDLLASLREAASALCAEIASRAPSSPSDRQREVTRWADALVAQVGSHLADDEASGAATTARFVAVAARAEVLLVAMDFSFLYHPERHLFAIGQDVAADGLDASFYDLLASESRLGSFVAIAKGDVPVKHWYKLGRPLAPNGGRRALLSWTGTMFEYLMPSLLMRSYGNTLLDESCRAAVERQITYGHDRGVPWGVSESAYNARDLSLNYQYAPFGVPGLGIKRGLADDLVIAPYATALALAVAPRAAVDNLTRLVAEGLEGDHGFYESIDYTPTRVPEGERGSVVRAFMAHHQGMTLLAIAEHLCGGRMCARFHADPRVKATELLLEERVPYEVPSEERTEEQTRRVPPPRAFTHAEWSAFSADAPPDVQLLSNGRYSVMVTAAGGGYSRRGSVAITRWREDPTRDCWGQFLYVRDADAQAYWSATHQPVLDSPSSTEVCFPVDCAEFRRVDDGIEAHLVVSVATEDDAEVRAIKVTNLSSRPRVVEVTSYAEIVLAPQNADVAHPAFAKLFVETELVAASGALLASRRPRVADEPRVWAVHVSAVDGDALPDVEHETDRARFLGRGRSPSDPAAMRAPLSGTTGAVLDPIFSLRRRVRLEPGKSARLFFSIAVADSRAEALALAQKYADAAAAKRASALAWTQAQSQLHYLDISAEDARLYLRVAARLLYASRSLRASDDIISRNRRGQSGLWSYGISGDLPIVLLRVDGEGQTDLLREVLRAHEYWRMRGLSADLVIINDHPPSYLLTFQDSLLDLVRSGPSATLVDKPGGIFVRRSDVMPAEDLTLLAAAARVVLVGGRGTLTEQVDRRRREHALPRALVPRRAPRPVAPGVPSVVDLQLDNGLGGFSEDGKEYVMRLAPGRHTPAPWVNVMANPGFGALVSEAGSGYLWADNCHENRLSEWTNDPVSDPSTGALYVRDEDTGEVFTPTPMPMGSATAHVVRHGQGYSTFHGKTGAISHELTVFVAADDPVHVSLLSLRNDGERRRRLTCTCYLEWTLGAVRADAAPHVATSIDPETGAMFARNTYPNDLGARVAFADTIPRFRAFTGDRAEMLGQNGDPSNPAAMGRVGLSGTVGAGYDPCAALQVDVVLEPGERRDIAVVVGQALDATHARAIVTRFRERSTPRLELAIVKSRWDSLLSAIEIETPDRGLDLLVNRWLVYQIVSCRLWGRTGLYQSGGAYGFRDQLQDVAALVYSVPALAREHLLRAAARQFPQGDVQHWWHPPSGRGVRTRISDDLLWLPFITAHYIEKTGDAAVLDEEVGFIEARALEPGEAEAYLLPTLSDERASLYEHCLRAVDRSLAVGAHGLPLIGCGDWNDGMNRVGAKGQGESVWMAWFLVKTLRDLAPLCRARHDAPRAERYLAHATALVAAVEAHGWDGAWYLRAFFDDGTPLGSANSDECQLDSLSQSWSVISGAGDRARATEALASVEARLVDRDGGVVRLLAPPFDETPHDPGYIRGYVPGVRENGGQYTHAAAWVALAEAMLGHGDAAGSLLKLINPAHATSTPDGMDRYRGEPYVLAGDVGTVAPHTGRAGWTWYTGSASWMYRVALESLLGFQLRGRALTIAPCIPAAWPGFTVTYRVGHTTYVVRVDNPDGVETGVRAVTLDGQVVPEHTIEIVDDGGRHELVVAMGARSETEASVNQPGDRAASRSQ